ncbi:hypothetical protein FOCC_FOCC010852 [Frankliniella occidentalis]|nr:hypothetical protein FOCC_FOCC010852 [Frankliniella occidentalis]
MFPGFEVEENMRRGGSGVRNKKQIRKCCGEFIPVAHPIGGGWSPGDNSSGAERGGGSAPSSPLVATTNSCVCEPASLCAVTRSAYQEAGDRSGSVRSSWARAAFVTRRQSLHAPTVQGAAPGSAGADLSSTTRYVNGQPAAGHASGNSVTAVALTASTASWRAGWGGPPCVLQLTVWLGGPRPTALVADKRTWYALPHLSPDSGPASRAASTPRSTRLPLGNTETCARTEEVADDDDDDTDDDEDDEDDADDAEGVSSVLPFCHETRDSGKPPTGQRSHTSEPDTTVRLSGSRLTGGPYTLRAAVCCAEPIMFLATHTGRVQDLGAEQACKMERPKTIIGTREPSGSRGLDVHGDSALEAEPTAWSSMGCSRSSSSSSSRLLNNPLYAYVVPYLFNGKGKAQLLVLLPDQKYTTVLQPKPKPTAILAPWMQQQRQRWHQEQQQQRQKQYEKQRQEQQQQHQTQQQHQEKQHEITSFPEASIQRTSGSGEPRAAQDAVTPELLENSSEAGGSRASGPKKTKTNLPPGAKTGKTKKKQNGAAAEAVAAVADGNLCGYDLSNSTMFTLP